MDAAHNIDLNNYYIFSIIIYINNYVYKGVWKLVKIHTNLNLKEKH